MRTRFLLAIAVAACIGCIRSRATPLASREPALTVEVHRFGVSEVGIGCLPRTGDSTRFEVPVVVDSLGTENGGDVSLVRNVRRPSRPGYTYQSVTVEIQRAGQTRIVGTSCWQDAGIVVRSSPAVLNHASIAIDAPASVLVRILDDRGRALRDSVWSTLQGRSLRVEWVRR